MRKYVWFALAVIALAVLLVPFLSDLAREVVLVELLRLAWKVERLVDSLPQEPFWIAFLLIAALVAAISVLPRPQGTDPAAEPTRQTGGQVADLALLIRRAGRRPYFRRRLVQRLSHLGREVYANRHGGDAPGLRDGLREASGGMFLTVGRPNPRSSRSQAEAGAGAWHTDLSLEQALADLRGESLAPHRVDDRSVERFVQLLEDQLEVDDGRFHRSRR